MKTFLRTASAAALLLAGIVFLIAARTPRTPVFYMAGDSTMAEGRDPVKSPARGWGQVFDEYLKDIKVVNCSSPGQSSKSFRQPGKDRWAPILEAARPGDFVFIQFGHNDPKPDSVRNTTPDQFAANLERYITEVRATGATPILLTSIERRHFESDSTTLRHTHAGYIEKNFEVAEKMGVALIDLNKLTRKMILSYPAEESKKFFMWVEPGTWELFPNGNKDNTHLNILGARVVAGMAAIELGKLYPELRSHIRRINKMSRIDPEYAEVKKIIKRVYQ